MKLRDLKTLKDKGREELEKMLVEERDRLRGTRFAVSTGQEKGVRALRSAKRTIARIMTLLNRKDAGAKPAAKA